MNDSAIGWGQLIADSAPVIVPIASAAVTALIAVAVNAFARWTGVKIDAAFEAKLQIRQRQKRARLSRPRPTISQLPRSKLVTRT